MIEDDQKQQVDTHATQSPTINIEHDDPVDHSNNITSKTDMSNRDIFQLSTPPSSLKDCQRQQLILNRCPLPTDKLPSKSYTDKRKKSGQAMRHCQLKWFNEYTWLAYSSSTKGLGCLACILFPTQFKHGIADNLISKPYDNWKDAAQELAAHSTVYYHLQSEAKLQAFIETYITKSQVRVDTLLDKEDKSLIKRNRQVLSSIVKGLIFCGRYGLSLRGHRDNNLKEHLTDKGVFAGLLSLMIESGDSTLSEHFDSCAKNCTMTSSVTQNDLIDCIKLVIQSHIVKEIEAQTIGPLFSISADEVTDVAKWEQLGEF